MKRVKLAPTPRSNATNAYELLNDVCRVVLEEPKRAYMTTYISAFQDPSTAKIGGPACGTVGCIAGWVGILKRPRGAQNGDDVRGYDESGCRNTMDERAEGLLGLSTDDLFTSDLYDTAGATTEYTYGTRDYARAVVRKIRAFQKQHRAQLLAKAV